MVFAIGKHQNPAFRGLHFFGRWGQSLRPRTAFIGQPVKSPKTIEQFAFDFHAATVAAIPAKNTYYNRLRQIGRDTDVVGILRLNPDDAECHDLIVGSAIEYKAYRAAQRRIRYTKDRLMMACAVALSEGSAT